MTYRILLAAGASLAALTLTAPALAETEAKAPDYPQMTFGEWGFDPATIDSEVDPGDDFNAYANGGWNSRHELPADRPRFSSADFLQEKSRENIAALIADLAASNPAPGTSARRIVDAYNAYLDRDGIEAAGMAPLQPYLQNVYSAPDLTSLARLFPQAGYPGLISAGVGPDSKNPTEHEVSVGFVGMGMSDRDYYLVDSERNLEIRAKYKELLEFMLGKAGYQDPVSAAAAVYAFERKVAELEWDRQFFRNPDLTYNAITRAEFEALSPQFPLAAFLESSEFAQVDKFLIAQIPPTEEEIAKAGLSEAELTQIGGGLPAMMDLLLETPLATLKAYMAARMVASNASVLPADVYDASFDFYGRTIQGQQAPRPIDHRATGAVEGMLGEQLGALYVERYFPPEAKARMDTLVENLRAAMREQLTASEWMTEATKAAALTKLEAMEPMIGYPEKFETYEGLEISADSAFQNRMNAIAWAIADNRAELDEPVDRSEWFMTPQTVNAYNAYLQNQIVFPAAFLQPPMFNLAAEAAVNYGAIGAVIGHEIGHGFDDSGSRYDESGTLRDWWQPEDKAAFAAKGDAMVEFINAYCPLDNGELCLTGRQSLGEVLGDAIGLQMAYRAYQMSLGGEEAPVIDGLTGDQRFFLGFAQSWRGIESPEWQRMLLISASHPPNEFRLNNAVRHMDAWYEAFNVTPDDALYVAPEDRIKIW
ncbi:M13 family metallopeptidase [Altererythrobacter sp. MF3-039]|uniref:M13 family metallopeptidase n=1 Tax=Altererythrobacter sp. MF3-039 TaxID=3252901 RepID=UPI00390CD47E